VIADLVYSAVNEDSLMTEKLRRRGLRIGRHYGVDPFTTATVGQIMTAEVQSLDETATVGDARARFANGGHGAYPIVAGGRLVGIVSRGDVLREDCDDDEGLIEHASRDVMTVAAGDSAEAVVRVMLEERVEHVPVVDGDGTLVGICTRSDLLKVRRTHLELETGQAGLRPRRSA
jgi:CBS domain-containing protein